MTTFRAALVQMCSGRDVDENVATASRLIREAAAAGADYIQTPEVTTLIEPDRTRLFTQIEADDGSNRAVCAFQALARELGRWVHIGSMAVRMPGDKAANRAFLIRPDGAIAARYDKIHMFNVQLASGETYRESKTFEPGEQAVVAQLPWGGLGITICYDLRFPGLYRALAKAGAKMIAIPSAFTVPTGEAHWHALMRARAIETRSFVFAAAQAGTHSSGRRTYGHSVIVSPEGHILAEGDGTTIGIHLADIDLALVDTARRQVPSLDHDRAFTIVAETVADPLSRPSESRPSER
jgi:predicted amidohydrolase